MIKKIHRIWLGPNPMPDNYKAFGNKWKELNPDWEIIDWTQDMIENEEWINRSIYDSIGVPPEGKVLHDIGCATQRADVISYDIIYKYGGLYVNTDIDPVKPLESFFEMFPQCFELPSAGKEDDYRINNGVMWSPRENVGFWLKPIHLLAQRYNANPYEEMIITTGPAILTECYYNNSDELHIFDIKVFNPIHFTQVASGSDAEYNVSELPQETVGVHHWGHKKNGRSNYTYY